VVTDATVPEFAPAFGVIAAASTSSALAVVTIMRLGVAFATRGLWKLWIMAPRLAGAAFCGVGFAALVTQLVNN